MRSDLEDERSPAARVLAERALIWLVHELQGIDLPIIVVGGLVPEVLAREAEVEAPAHIGTADVDILIALQTSLEVDLAPLEEALNRAGFDVDPKVREGWRWRAKIGATDVKIEFLCDLDDQPANRAIPLPGCAVATAANLRGAGFVARDYVTETLTGELPNGDFVSVTIKFAGLSGYLMSKLVSARERGKGKDYYDLIYVLLNNRAGGPREAAEQLASGQFAQDLRQRHSLLAEIEARFARASDVGPRSYAAQTVAMEPEADFATLAEDAVSAIAEFMAGLGVAP